MHAKHYDDPAGLPYRDGSCTSQSFGLLEHTNMSCPHLTQNKESFHPLYAIVPQMSVL